MVESIQKCNSQNKKNCRFDSEVVAASNELHSTKIEDIKNEQKRYNPTSGTEKDREGIFRKEKQIWIPSESANLKISVTEEAHGKERGYQA